jgi:hypothetical protein
MDDAPIRKAHFFVNSKGGVGKSHCSVIVTQGYRDRGLPVKAFDADAMSATFSSFPALQVTRIPLMSGDAIDPRQFDAMLEPILTEDSNFVVDTGASSFVELNRYFLRNDVPGMIHDAGKILVANVIVVGGAMFAETCNNLDSMASQMPPQVEIAVWLNEHFGPVARNGKDFEEMEIYERHRARIAALVRMPDWTYTQQATFGVDMRCMMTAGLTFAEVQGSPDFTLMAKSRLRRIERDLQGKLAHVI